MHQECINVSTIWIKYTTKIDSSPTMNHQQYNAKTRCGRSSCCYTIPMFKVANRDLPMSTIDKHSEKHQEKGKVSPTMVITLNIAKQRLLYQFRHESMVSPTLLMSIVNSKNQQYCGNAPIVLLRTMNHGNIKMPFGM